MRVDRLDRTALAFGLGLLALIAIVFLRGDQVGAQIIQTSPGGNATNVATRSQLVLTFSEPMLAASMDSRLQISPSLSGTLRWNGATAFFVPALPLLPDTAYTVTVLSGARSARGRSMLRDLTWSFRTGHPRVVYLAPATGTGDLFVHDLGGNTAPQRITSEPYGVFDYAVSPDGTSIVYSATRDGSGVRDLWLINPDGSNRRRIVPCDEQVCQTASWSSDSSRIAFERRNLVQGALGKSPGASRIWLYDVTNKALGPLLSDSQQLGMLPRWAPQGSRLSYYDSANSVIMVVDVSSGDRAQLPSVLGDSGTWSPNGDQLVFPELSAAEGGQYSQLLRADLVRNVITPVTTLSSTNDGSVVWSPIGPIIAFSRQRTSLTGSTASYSAFGPQIWISAPDGQNAHQLTNDTGFSYGGLAWSPDGEWIAAVRNNLQTPNPKPEIWLVHGDGARQFKLADDATIPAWLP